MPIAGQGKVARQTKVRNLAGGVLPSGVHLAHELNGLILTNKKILLSHLFKAVGETLVDFGHTRLGGQIGFITVLHTWDQTLLDHFHLHCLVPAGALSYNQKCWMPARKNFLFPVKALSVVFCGKFLDLLKSAFAQNKLLFVGQTASLADPIALASDQRVTKKIMGRLC